MERLETEIGQPTTEHIRRFVQNVSSATGDVLELTWIDGKLIPAVCVATCEGPDYVPAWKILESILGAVECLDGVVKQEAIATLRVAIELCKTDLSD